MLKEVVQTVEVENHHATSNGTGQDSWKSEFECPVCLEMMTGGVHIYQCGTGHVICGHCRHKLTTDTCPTCRGVITGRSTVIERLAAALIK